MSQARSSLGLSEAIEFTIDLAARDPARYSRAAGRLIGRLATEKRLTLDEVRTLLLAFDHLPDDPEKARVVLRSWARYRRKGTG